MSKATHVWIVEASVDYEGSEIVEIYSDEKKAEAMSEKQYE